MQMHHCKCIGVASRHRLRGVQTVRCHLRSNSTRPHAGGIRRFAAERHVRALVLFHRPLAR